MSKELRAIFSLALFATLLIAGRYLAQQGRYGWTLFVVLPVLAGALGTWSFRPATGEHALRIGAIVGVLECGLFLLLGLEGVLCMAMSLPVVVPLTVAGSLLSYWIKFSSKSKRPAAMALLLPISLFFDMNAKPPVYEVTTSIVVNAAPERVWKYVVAFPDITTKRDWVLRTGLAYPIRTRIDGSGVGVTRHCDVSTGTVQERVVLWDEPRELRFVVTATPPAMEETGLYGPIQPKHLSGYFISKEGRFVLTPLANGRTFVEGTSWYQHGLWPAEYWRLWSDAVVHHIHRRVLEHIRELSEKT